MKNLFFIFRSAMLSACLLFFSSSNANASSFPSLDEAIRKAQERAPVLVDVRGALGAAEAQGTGARVGPFGNPYVEIISDRSRLTRGVNFSASAHLPIEVQGQRSARIEEWKRLVGWRRAGVAVAASAVLGEAVEAYGLVEVTRARVALSQRGEEDAREEVRRVAGRVAVGDATIYEFSLSEAELARWSQLRAESSAAHARELGRLSALVGEPLASPPAEATIDVPHARQHIPEAEFDTWLDSNSELSALAAEAVYWSANAERYRRDAWAPISIVASAGRGDYGEARYGGGLAWSLPVVRRNQGEVARAGGEQGRASTFRAALTISLRERLRSAAKSYEVARLAAQALLISGIAAHERVVEAAVEAQRAGKGDITRVLIARRDLATARTRHLDLIESAWRAYAELASVKGELP